VSKGVNNISRILTTPGMGGVWNTHPCMLPRVLKGDQKGHYGITYSVRYFLKTA
jgi:hypothetical protein